MISSVLPKPKARSESCLHYTMKGQIVDGLRARGVWAEEEYRIPLGVAHSTGERERWAIVDVAIPAQKLALEVEATSGYNFTKESRDRLLEGLGWRVIDIEYWRLEHIIEKE